MSKFVPGPPSKGNVVERKMIGNTTVLISDDSCRGLTFEDGQKIVNETCNKLLPVLQKVLLEQMQKEGTA